jgi:hypothetical protein
MALEASPELYVSYKGMLDPLSRSQARVQQATPR